MTFDPAIEPGSARVGCHIEIGTSSSVDIPNEEIREALKRAFNPRTNPYILGECPWCDRLVGLPNMYNHGRFCAKRFNPYNFIRYWIRKIIEKEYL